MGKPIVLLILDGWGIGRSDHTNPLFVAKLKTIKNIQMNYASGALQASGIAVGLPWEEEGNSEVGHLTIGSGKIIYQHYPRITLAIQNNLFEKNEALLNAFTHAKKNSSGIHLVGLLAEGNVHAAREHVRALIRLAKDQGITNLNLHLFADGKDSPPRSVLALLEEIRSYIKEMGVGRIASIAGRFYSLDRDNHWDRTKATYDMLVGKGTVTDAIETNIQKYYDKGLVDEFIEPFMVGPEKHPIQENDAVIFFNYREDSIQQIASSFILKYFDKFPVQQFSNLYVTTMTKYTDKFDVPVAFPAQTIESPLGKVLADNNLLQIRIAETEKYAHVTYFFNGYQEEPYKNEYRVLIPSKNVARHDEAPEMQAREIATRVIESVEQGGFDFVLANFANPDMIAHTGNFDSTLQAVLIVDQEIEKIMNTCLAKDAMLIITADHGNAEQMIDPLTGRPQTTHAGNLVPFYLIAKEFKRQKTEAQAQAIEKEAIGLLSDVTPTILELLGIQKPADMTGQSLLKFLR